MSGSEGLNHTLIILSDVSDVEVDRDEDNISPQPHNVQYNGRDGGYLEVPPEGITVSRLSVLH